jgi:ubiquinol-cytochrome c reductase subunit 7
VKDNEITREALRRLPKDVYIERQYRLTRAINLSAIKSVLPESEWIKPDDVNCFIFRIECETLSQNSSFFLKKKDLSYLKPFIEQVVAERQEKDDWDSGKIQ